MESRRVRSEADWQALVSEFQALKRKLQSKSEALLIISKDLDATQKERDQYKLMAEKLRVRCQAYKRQFSDYPLTKDQASLIQMLRDTKNQKIAHQKQNEALQLKLNEALGDVKLLRERFARQRIGDEGIGPRHFPAHEREELVSQLEDAKQQAEHFRQENNIANDQIAEIIAEKDEMQKKAERLNNELNFMLNGDKKRIIDIDTLCMENKYLQERVKQCQEEKNSLHAQLSKLKALLNARKAQSADIKPGRIRNSGLVISPKQLKEILTSRAGLPNSAETVSDLQSIAAALLETVNDKNLALHHLRSTNKILGKRVAELELKLKTLEVAGLWTLSGQKPPTSTPEISLDDVKPGSRIENEEEFFYNLGSRLCKLTDVCDRSFKEYKLVSLTPESASSASDVTGLDDVTGASNSSGTKPDCDISGDENVDITYVSNGNVMGQNSDVIGCTNDVTGVPSQDHDVSADCDDQIGDITNGCSFDSDVTHKSTDLVFSNNGHWEINSTVSNFQSPPCRDPHSHDKSDGLFAMSPGLESSADSTFFSAKQDEEGFEPPFISPQPSFQDSQLNLEVMGGIKNEIIDPYQTPPSRNQSQTASETSQFIIGTVTNAGIDAIHPEHPINQNPSPPDGTTNASADCGSTVTGSSTDNLNQISVGDDMPINVNRTENERHLDNDVKFVVGESDLS